MARSTDEFRVSMADEHDVAGIFLRWTSLRAVFHRGYVLVSSLYFVIVAHLTASQLVLLGTVVGATLLLSDIPTGVWSDAYSRKWPLVAGHVFIAAGMMMTGIVSSFPLLLVTQVLWGVGWGFSSGADVAWITDELGQPGRIDQVLAARARWELAGGAAGMVLFGLLGWATTLGIAAVVSGAAMLFAGLLVGLKFPEEHFSPVRAGRRRAASAVFRRGVRLARGDIEILLVLAATFVINAASAVAWLFPKQLIDLGFPNGPVLWYAGLGVLASAVGFAALRVVEGRIGGAGTARRTYILSCVAGVAGLCVLSYAPEAITGAVGVLLVRGIAINVTRPVSVIWVNRRTSSDVRATLQSFLGQAESAGEILGGFGLAAIAGGAGVRATLLSAGVLVACAGAIAARVRNTKNPSLAT